MMAFLVLVSVFACAFASAIPKGLIPRLDDRIIGGQDTTIEKFPHQVSLRYIGNHICGGSVYNKNVIVTAAHCVSGFAATYLTVVVGITRLSEKGQSFQIAKAYVHENYSSYTLDNDVAVLVLKKSLTFGNSVQPIPLQEANVEVETGTVSQVSGWGRTRENGDLANVLQYVEVKVINHDVCAAQYKIINKITDSMICAGVENGGRDACQGDSGGPLISNGRLIGIVSWGFGCALPRYPGVYAKISYLNDWIKLKAGEQLVYSYK